MWRVDYMTRRSRSWMPRRSLRFVSATVPDPPPFEKLVPVYGPVCTEGYNLIAGGIVARQIAVEQLAGWFHFRCMASSHSPHCRKAYSRPIPLTATAIHKILEKVAPIVRKRPDFEESMWSLIQNLSLRTYPPEPYELPRGLGWVRELREYVAAIPKAVERLMVELRSPVGAHLYTEIALTGVFRVPKRIVVDSIYDAEAYESAVRFRDYMMKKYSGIGRAKCAVGRMVQNIVLTALERNLPAELRFMVLDFL